MKLNKRAKKLIKKNGIDMFKCIVCGSIKPDTYRTTETNIFFYCKQHI